MSLAKPIFPQLNKSLEISKGIVFAAPLADGSVNFVKDVSGNKLHGVPTGTPTIVRDTYGYAINSVGDGENINFGQNKRIVFTDDTNDKPFTVYTRVKFNSITGTTVVSSKDGASSSREWNVLVHNAGKISMNSLDTRTGTYWIGRETGTSLISAGVWYGITVTYTGSGTSAGYKIYINEARKDSANFEGTPGSYVAMRDLGNDFTIGVKDGLIQGPDSAYSNAVLWNREITAREVALLHADPFAMYRKRQYGVAKAPEATGPPVGSLSMSGVGR